MKLLSQEHFRKNHLASRVGIDPKETRIDQRHYNRRRLPRAQLSADSGLVEAMGKN